MRTNQGILNRNVGRRARWEAPAPDAKPPVTAAFQKELAKPTAAKFGTEIPRIPIGRKSIWWSPWLKQRERKSVAILLMNC